eukprot:5537329-Amphidinium_carterae.1
MATEKGMQQMKAEHGSNRARIKVARRPAHLALEAASDPCKCRNQNKQERCAGKRTIVELRWNLVHMKPPKVN